GTVAARDSGDRRRASGTGIGPDRPSACRGARIRTWAPASPRDTAHRWGAGRAGGLASGLDRDHWGLSRPVISSRRGVPGASIARRRIGGAAGFRAALVVGRTGHRGGHGGGISPPGAGRNPTRAAKSATRAFRHELDWPTPPPAKPRDEARMGTLY